MIMLAIPVGSRIGPYAHTCSKISSHDSTRGQCHAVLFSENGRSLCVAQASSKRTQGVSKKGGDEAQSLGRKAEVNACIKMIAVIGSERGMGL